MESYIKHNGDITHLVYSGKNHHGTYSTKVYRAIRRFNAYYPHNSWIDTDWSICVDRHDYFYKWLTPLYHFKSFVKWATKKNDY